MYLAQRFSHFAVQADIRTNDTASGKIICEKKIQHRDRDLILNTHAILYLEEMPLQTKRLYLLTRKQTRNLVCSYPQVCFFCVC